MNLLVLGGSQFVGRHIVLRALERGHRVSTFTRGQTPDGLPEAVTRLHGDRDGQLTALETGRWDAVVDVSGYLPRVVRQSAELLRGRVGRYLFISTVSVYAPERVPGEREATGEEAPLIELDDPATEDVGAAYGGLKVLCERLVTEVYGERATHVRPHIVAGPGDHTRRFTAWPERLAGSADVLAPGDGRDPVQYVDARDLAAFVVRLLEDDRGGIFNAAAPSMPWSAFLGGVAEGTGSRARLLWTPQAELDRQGLGWTELPLYLQKDRDDAAIMRVDAGRARRAGLHCRPLAETARDVLNSEVAGEE